jgi:hypothetical protein
MTSLVEIQREKIGVGENTSLAKRSVSFWAALKVFTPC